MYNNEDFYILLFRSICSKALVEFWDEAPEAEQFLEFRSICSKRLNRNASLQVERNTWMTERNAFRSVCITILLLATCARGPCIII